ncbi:MAG: hypothetical protein FWE23_06380 [Chitinivibrionia bacterium]|nr:hypothetical protein [Chitinivibrionia bacterium]
MLEKNVDDDKKLKGLERYSARDIENWKENEKIIVAKSDSDVEDFIKNSLNGNIKFGEMRLGRIDNGLAQRILNETGVNLSGYSLLVRADDVRHVFNKHGSSKDENSRGQQAITARDIEIFPEVIADFDLVRKGENNTLLFTKEVSGKLTAVSIYANGRRSLSLKTMYKRIDRSATQAANAKRSRQTSKNDLGGTSDNKIQTSNKKSQE